MASLEILYNHVSGPTLFTLDTDPTAFDWGGTNAERGSLLIRTDNDTLWYKSGGSPTGWLLLTGGGGPGTYPVLQDEGVPVAGAPHDTYNFTGAGVTVTDAGGGVATINIPGGGGDLPVLQDEGIPVAGAPHDTYNFTGAGVTVTDAGGGVATINVPGATEGVIAYANGQDIGPPPSGPFTSLGFYGVDWGELITAVDAGIWVFKTEGAQGEGGIDPDVALDMTASRHFLDNTGLAETEQVFLLANEAVSNGRIHYFVNVSDPSNERTVTVRTATADYSTATQGATLCLIWEDDTGTYRQFGPSLGWTQAALTAVVTDATLVGNGTVASPLGVADPYVAPAIGGTLTGGTDGSVLFSGAAVFAQDNANFFWDNTNKRLGIGTNTPEVAMSVHDTRNDHVVAKLQNAHASGYSSVAYMNNAGVHMGNIGYSNAGAVVSPGAFHFYAASTTDWVFWNSTSNLPGITAVIQGSDKVAWEMANGSTTAVSSANTGRLRYNSTGQKFQVSLNGAAYVDLITSSTAFTLDIGDAIGGGSTVGSVLFVGAGNVLQQDNSNLFWDDTNNRLGIGTASPGQTLSVLVNGADTGVVALRNSHNTGYVSIGFTDDANAFAGFVGYANGSTAVEPGKMVFYGSKQWVWYGTNRAIVVTPTSGSVSMDFADGAAAGVSAANFARLRYSQAAGKLQVSISGGAYADLH